MNVSACSTHKNQGIAGGKGSVAAGSKGLGTGTELPDFAAFLGMALSLGDLEQQLGQGAAGQAAQATAGNGKAAMAGMACGPVTVFGDPAETDATGDGDANGSLTAALALSAQGLPIKPQVQTAANQTPQMATGAAQKAMGMATAMGGATSARNSAGATNAGENTVTREWNVQDLAHQLRAAIGQVATGSQQQEKAAMTPTHTTLTTAQGKAQGEKIHSEGTPATARTAGAGNGQGEKGQAQQPGLAIQPAPWNGGNKSAGQSLYGSAPHLKDQGMADVAASAAAKKTDALDTGASADPAAVTAGPAPLTWNPQPVASSGHNETRMPRMIEQVRQVADFLAERTEGVIKMGEQGVEANLKLYPPDLGGVRVQLTVNSDRTTQAQFIVERPETAQLLQQHLRSFQQGLESHGLTVDKVQVTVQGTVRPASSAGAEGGWRQNSTQDFRRENAQTNQRDGQQPRRGGRGTQQEFEG